MNIRGGFMLAVVIALSRIAVISALAQDSDDQSGLNEAYQAEMRQLDNAGKAALRSMERAWIAFKESDYGIVVSLDKMAGVEDDGYAGNEDTNQAAAISALGKPKPSDQGDDDDSYSSAGSPSTAGEADKALNEVYRQCLQLIGADRAQKVKAAQALWIAYRDQYCSLDTHLRGGQPADFVLRDITSRRAGQLGHYGTLLTMVKFAAAGIPPKIDSEDWNDVEGTPDDVRNAFPTDIYRFGN